MNTEHFLKRIWRKFIDFLKNYSSNKLKKKKYLQIEKRAKEELKETNKKHKEWLKKSIERNKIIRSTETSSV